MISILDFPLKRWLAVTGLSLVFLSFLSIAALAESFSGGLACGNGNTFDTTLNLERAGDRVSGTITIQGVNRGRPMDLSGPFHRHARTGDIFTVQTRSGQSFHGRYVEGGRALEISTVGVVSDRGTRLVGGLLIGR